MFKLIDSENPIPKRMSDEDFTEINPSKFLKNLNEKDEDIDYLADSDNVDYNSNL